MGQEFARRKGADNPQNAARGRGFRHGRLFPTLTAAAPPLVLASTSRFRRDLLQRLLVPFRCVPPEIDEATVKAASSDPQAIARELARRKALAVANRHPGAIVIGSDQVASVDGDLLDKPGTAAGAIAQLRRLQGREHLLLTAVAIAHPGTLLQFVVPARMSMRPLTDEEVRRYVAADQPLDCAGSYKVESLGIALFDRIDCDDHTAIIGLPLLALGRELRRLGMQIP